RTSACAPVDPLSACAATSRTDSPSLAAAGKTPESTSRPAPHRFPNRPLPETVFSAPPFPLLIPHVRLRFTHVHPLPILVFICREVSGGSFSRERWDHRTGTKHTQAAAGP